MIREFNGIRPNIHPKAYVDETAVVIGKVTIEANASIWPYCVLRGDVEAITIGENTNVQEHSVIHTDYDLPTVVGKNVTVGHSVNLHGCTIRDHCLIGIGSTVLNGSVVEEDCIVGAGALVSPKTVIPKGHMALGVPARAVRKLKPEEIEHIRFNASDYVNLKEKHRKR